MKLTRLLNPEAILIPLEPDTKEEALARMVQLLVKSYGLEAEEEIAGKVYEREKKMSTGIGYGVAVPHAKYDKIQDIKIAVGISKKGIPFDAIDDEPVYIVFALVSPADTVGQHVRTLSAISRITSYEQMRMRIKNARDTEEFLKVLAEGEEKYL